MDVEVAERALVEQPLNVVPAQVAGTLVIVPALGSDHEFEVVLGVHEGGEGGWAAPTVVVHIEIACVASISEAIPGGLATVALELFAPINFC